MTIERLSPTDRLMLWPDRIWPQDIGAVAVLDGGSLVDAAGCFDLAAARDAVARRLHHVPRFRQLLYVPPSRLGGPLWIDDPAFNVSNHVLVAQLPAGGDEAALLAATERLMRERLDRSRPLWEIWFLPGLPDNRVGMFVRTHHCIADGMAGVATLATFLDTTPDATATPAAPWTPQPAPAERELATEAQLQRRRERRSRLSRLAHPVTTARLAAGTLPGMRELLAERPLPPTSLDRVIGPDRALSLIRGSLVAVKEIAHAYDAKVNDVFLTAIAGGLRALLLGRGEPVEGTLMRIYVPVSLRHGQYGGARGNKIAEMVVPLPIGVRDPVSRLHEITSETARRKARSRPSVGNIPHGGIAGWAFLKLIERQRVNVCSADLPGPEIPLYFAGARLLEVFPILPLISRVSLGVAALSYVGEFNITAVADRNGYPDLEVFRSGLRKEMEALYQTLPMSSSRRISSAAALTPAGTSRLAGTSPNRQPTTT